MIEDGRLRPLATGATTPWREQPVDEPDLASWAWHRATGAAVTVLAMAACGLVLGAFELVTTDDPDAAEVLFAYPFVLGTSAAVGIYLLGPVVALVERRRFAGRPPTPRRLTRLWMVGGVAIAALTIFGVLVAPIVAGATYVGVLAGLRLPSRWGRPLAVLVPVGVTAAFAGPTGLLSLVEAVLVLALLVVVPASVALVPGGGGGAGLVTLWAGAITSSTFLAAPGPVAAVLVVPWVVVTSVGAVGVAWRWWHGPRAPSGLVRVAASGYLAFGGLWLLADRAAYEPAGFGPPFVQLTAVHFTYAGFVATVLAARAWARRPDDRVAALAVAAIACAPLLVAIGFVVLGALQIVGAVLLTVGTYALAWVTLRHVVPAVPRAAAWLLGLSSVSVLIPMLLAVQWAVGANLGTPALSIPQMAATHGVANAVGFALLGVLGWRLVPRETPVAGDGGGG